VWCEREVQIARVLQRNPELNREMVEAIINVQAKDQQLLKIGDVIVDNSENYTNHLQACNQVNILTKYIKNLSLFKLSL
jgi:dephospho-CoA kinase